jgi:hypothetical protein
VSSTRTGVIPESELKEEAARLRALTIAQQEGLVGWWRLDEGVGATVSDAANVGHTGVVHGLPKWVAGKMGAALKFGQGEYVTTDARYALKTLTLSAWVRHDEFSKLQQRYVSLSEETAVIRCDTDRHLHFYIKTNGALQQLYVANALELGKWTHIAGTWDGKTQKLYKDGVLLDSKTPGGSLKGEVSVSISSQNEYMRGAIDDVRIYDRALSDTEIRKLAEGSTSTILEIAPPPPPAGKPWRPLFDGTSGSVLKGGNLSWKVDNGALAYIPGTNDAAQTRDEFSDGELRIRFEVKDVSRLWFAFRQGPSPPYVIRLDDLAKTLDEKTHELIIAGKGEQVTATLDGKPLPVSPGASKTGCLQFNASGKACRILSIDVR